MQNVTVCCSVLQSRWCSVSQRIEVCCSVLECVVVCHRVLLRCVAVCCSVLQCGAACYSVLQRGAVFCSHDGAVWCRGAAVWCSMMPCSAVLCRVLQCTTLFRSVLQCVVVCCNKTQRVRDALVSSSHKRTILPHEHQFSTAASSLMRTRNHPPIFASLKSRANRASSKSTGLFLMK